MYSIENEPTFRRNMLPSFSGSKKKPSWWQACCLLHAGLLLGLYFDPENGGDMFLRNVG
jgi:hypothetical protein